MQQLSTIEEILERHPEAWKSFFSGDDLILGSDFYNDLYEYFLNSGEMPIGIAKARTGDPDLWISEKLDQYSKHNLCQYCSHKL